MTDYVVDISNTLNKTKHANTCWICHERHLVLRCLIETSQKSKLFGDLLPFLMKFLFPFYYKDEKCLNTAIKFKEILSNILDFFDTESLYSILC